MTGFSRRTFLAASAAAVAAAGAGGAYWWYRGRDMAGMPHGPTSPTGEVGFPNALTVPNGNGAFGVLDVSGPISIAARTVNLPILSGPPAPLLVYEVEHAGKTYFNPVLRLTKGATFTAQFRHALEDSSIIHWHGMLVDARNDGHPRDAIARGATYSYRFEVANRAATYWYHPHPHKVTGKQTHLGLASLFIVEDEEERALKKALDLALGETDIPLVIQDKRFDRNGAATYAPTEDEAANGFLGDRILVNLTSRPHFDAASRLYRFRILNGSNARIYRLAFTRNDEPLEYRVIGTDGGLLDRAYPVKEAFLAPAERLDVLLDLTDAKVGDTVLLRSLGFDPMHGEMAGMAGMKMEGMPGMKMGAQPHDMKKMGAQPHDMAKMGGHPDMMLPDGAAFDIMQVRVTREARGAGVVPARLSDLRPPAVPAVKPRVFTLDQRDRIWRMNGLTFDMTATPITVKRGAREIWEVRNVEKSMPHPMHLHGFHFRVLERIGSPEQVRRNAVDKRGLTAPDLGAKDTVLVWPGETVRLAIDFSHDFAGDQVYLFHCHNLEHEDQGMMLNVKVAA